MTLLPPLNSQQKDQHELWMRRCLELAKEAADLDEVPVGAIVVRDGVIVGEGFNLREKNLSALEHAEIIAVREASAKLGKWRLSDCVLYVTLEPCLMCAGALGQARIGQVFYGAKDPKAGAMGSLYNVHEDARLNHRFVVHSGILEDECGKILKEFFARKRS